MLRQPCKGYPGPQHLRETETFYSQSTCQIITVPTAAYLGPGPQFYFCPRLTIVDQWHKGAGPLTTHSSKGGYSDHSSTPSLEPTGATGSVAESKSTLQMLEMLQYQRDTGAFRKQVHCGIWSIMLGWLLGPTQDSVSYQYPISPFST